MRGFTLVATAAVLGLASTGSVAAASFDSPETSPPIDLFGWLSLGSLIAAPIVLILVFASGAWRLPPSARIAAWRIPIELSALVFATSILLGGVGSWAALTVFGSDSAPGINRDGLATLGMYVGSLLPLAVLAGLWPHMPRPTGAEKSLPNLLAAGLGLIACVLGLPLIEAVSFLGTQTQEWLQGAEGSPIAHATLSLLVNAPSSGWWWVVAGGAVLGAPIVEETLYRGCVQQALRRLKIGRWWAILLTSTVFVLMHLPALPTETLMGSMAALLMASILFGWIREWTGCLAASISAHVLFNAFNLVLAMVITA